MTENQLYFAFAVLIVILIGILFSKNFKAVFSGKGLEVEKSENKDNVKISKIRQKSKLDVNTKEGQNLDIKDVSDSEINLNKDNKSEPK